MTYKKYHLSEIGENMVKSNALAYFRSKNMNIICRKKRGTVILKYTETDRSRLGTYKPFTPSSRLPPPPLVVFSIARLQNELNEHMSVCKSISLKKYLYSMKKIWARLSSVEYNLFSSTILSFFSFVS